MATIIVKNDTKTVTTLQLQAGGISIGRANDNDLPISDHMVSSHHARIFTYFNASYIEDLGSTNGTYINGKRIQKHTLHPGDIIKVGRQMLEVATEE